MIGHTCKVHSHTITNIMQQEYKEQEALVKQASFVNALSSVSQQIMGREYAYEKVQYQTHFSLPLKRNIFGLLTIPVMINDKKCTFIVDTGAQISGIKSTKVKELNIRKTDHKVCIGSIGGTQKQLQGLCSNKVVLGAIAYYNVPMIALGEKDFSMRFGNIDLFNFDGILGWDILSQLDFELDDINHQFIVLKNRFRFTNPNMIAGGFPCFLTKLADGSISLFGFDSGSKVSWIGENMIRKQKYAIIQEGNAFGFGVHGLEKMKLKIVDNCVLYLDKAEIKLSNTMSGRTNLFDNFSFDGVLGNEIFKGRRMRFVNSCNMVLIA